MSLSNLSKALSTTFSAQLAAHPLPEELQRTIETFLDSHPRIDDHDSQRLHEDLRTVYDKYVANNGDKLCPFIGVLRQLSPVIRSRDRLHEWWVTVVRPVVDSVGYKRDAVEEAREFLLSIMVFDPEEDPSREKAATSIHFTARLIEAYLARTRIPSGGEEDDVVSPEDDFVAHELENILVAFGRKMPKQFLVAIDELFVQKKYRAQALGLLSSFVRFQPPHLHLVLETDLINHLQCCLLIDTSTTIVDLALTILIMFLPHITSSLIPNLPKLFLIYSRLLCWDKYRNDSTDANEGRGSGIMSQYLALMQEKFDPLLDDPTWEKLHHSFDHPEAPPPRVDYYFTFLYGLFPPNFMNYVRKPRKTLKSMAYPDADSLDLNQDLIRDRTEPHRRIHLLHPNFFSTTAEDELGDNRWLKSDPADLVTECLDLCVAVSATLDDPGPPPTTALPPVPSSAAKPTVLQEGPVLADDEATLNNDQSSPVDPKSNSWRNTLSTNATSQSFASHLEPFSLRPRASHSSLGRAASKSSRTTSPTHKDGDVFDSPILGPQGSETTAEGGNDVQSSRKKMSRRVAAKKTTNAQFSLYPRRAGTEPHSRVSLQREVMLLRNDLNFERYLKQQHLSHIGQLQRRHIGEATVEAETQNLINTNKTLKAKLAKLNAQYEQLKKESMTSRTQSRRWESELSLKVRAYREEEKQWQNDEQALRLAYEQSRKECDHLRRMVVESEQRELQAQHRLEELEMNLEELGSLRRQVDEMEAKLRHYELRNMDFERAQESHEDLQTELEAAKLQLVSRDGVQEMIRRAYERKIADLESQLQSTMKQSTLSSGNLPSSVQQVIDSALASSNNKLLQLKKTHNRLLHKYTEMEMRYQELLGEREADAGPLANRDVDTSHLTSRAPHLSLPHAFSEPLLDSDYLDEHTRQSSRDTHASGGASSFPSRFQSLQVRPVDKRSQGHDQPHTSSSAPESVHDFHAYNPTAPLKSDRSIMSFESSGSNKSDGRGTSNALTGFSWGFNSSTDLPGAANNLAPVKKSKKDDKKSTKSSRLRGIRGFM